MSYRITINLTASADSLEDAAALVRAVSAEAFGKNVTIRTEYESELVGYAAIGSAISAQQEAVAAPKPAETVKVTKPKATKPVADPAPAPASAAPAEPPPAPAPAPASPAKAPTHADLRAILVPVASGGKSKEVGAFVRGGGGVPGKAYTTVDSIPAEDLPAVIANAKKEFAA